jgi:hypothetical protein
MGGCVTVAGTPPRALARDFVAKHLDVSQVVALALAEDGLALVVLAVLDVPIIPPNGVQFLVQHLGNVVHIVAHASSGGGFLIQGSLARLKLHDLLLVQQHTDGASS